MTQRSSNVKMAIALFALILLVKLLDFIPWWSFVVPVLALGIIATAKGWKVAGFTTGFITGFTIWAGANLSYHLSFDGNLVSRVGVPAGIIALIASGIIGGLLTGLALYTGQQLIKTTSEPSL